MAQLKVAMPLSPAELIGAQPAGAAGPNGSVIRPVKKQAPVQEKEPVVEDAPAISFVMMMKGDRISQVHPEAVTLWTTWGFVVI